MLSSAQVREQPSDTCCAINISSVSRQAEFRYHSDAFQNAAKSRLLTPGSSRLYQTSSWRKAANGKERKFSRRGSVSALLRYLTHRQLWSDSRSQQFSVVREWLLSVSLVD